MAFVLAPEVKEGYNNRLKNKLYANSNTLFNYLLIGSLESI